MLSPNSIYFMFIIAFQSKTVQEMLRGKKTITETRILI